MAGTRRTWGGRAAGAVVALGIGFSAGAAKPPGTNQPAVPPSSPSLPPSATKTRPDEARNAIEPYLEQKGLKTLLAEMLADRLNNTSGEERVRLADRLGRLYVELLAGSTTLAEREAWDERARELIKKVPEAQSFALRVDLAKTVYMKAQDQAERWLLRLLDPQETALAARTLKGLKQQFEALGGDLDRRAQSLERAVEAGQVANRQEEDLTEAKRLRSVSYFYAGWAGVYSAILSGTQQDAVDALKSFGWLTGRSGNQPALLDKLPRSLLKHDHIGRACLGVAMAASGKGDDVEAMRWLEVVDSEAAVPEPVKSQVLPRRVWVLSAARRWSDLDRVVRAARIGGGKAEDPPQPLPVETARLLAVLTMEAERSGSAAPMLEQLSQIAMQDLIARGEVAQVLDLATRYGTTPLGNSGFIPHYVRGAQAYNKADAELRAANGKAGRAADEPATEPATINQFRQAAGLLDLALQQPDAAKFHSEQIKTLMMCGRALYSAGDFERGADRFSRATALAQKERLGDPAQEGMWLAIIAMTRAVKAATTPMPAMEDKLDELSTLFVRTYPNTQRAATLLLQRADRGGLKDEEAAKVLLAVGKESPVHEASRRQAARLLYRIYRASNQTDKAFNSQRFITVAEELLATDRKTAVSQAGQASTDATQRVITLSLQMLDTLLSIPAPDVQRAQGVLDVLQNVSVYNHVDLAKWQDELAYRNFQMLVARGDMSGAEKIADDLMARAANTAPSVGQPAATISGPSRFALSAQRVLYLRALDQQRRLLAKADPTTEAKLAAARAVMKYGMNVIAQFARGEGALKDPAVVSLYNEVATAGEVLATIGGDSLAGQEAIRLDKALLEAQPTQLVALRRLAVLSDAAGDSAMALACWRQLSMGLQPGSGEWYHARYENIRLLMQSDPAAARTLLQQHVVLYPNYGSEPWGTKLRELERQLGGPAGMGGGTP